MFKALFSFVIVTAVVSVIVLGIVYLVRSGIKYRKREKKSNWDF